MVARLKLKGIDGGSHKRWSMWLNSKQREEPYPRLDMHGLTPGNRGHTRKSGTCTGAAWLSSARAVKCRVKSSNERNPCRQLLTGNAEYSGETAGVKPEEGGDDVKSSWPLHPGLQTCYNGAHKATRGRKAEQIAKIAPQFGLQAATRLHEAGIASNRGSECRGECVPEPCTHRPSSHESGGRPTVLSQPARGQGT